MRTYTKEELKSIISLHYEWLCGSAGGRRANLRNANLSCADLNCTIIIGADLRNANLSGANLSGANLSDANLSGANLSDSYLRNANLSCANLSGVDLRGANLWDTVGNGREVKSIQIFEEYPLTYTREHLQIGCKNYNFEKWWAFSDDDILKMDNERALVFWKKNKDFIKRFVESNPAV